MTWLSSLSPTLLIGISLLAIVQLTLQIAALVSLVRTPASRITIGGHKWVWALIIIFGEIVGAIVYFAAGRTPKPAEETAPSRPADVRSAAAADALYGAPAQPRPDAPASAAPSAPAAPAGSQPGAPLVPADDPEVGSDGTVMGELP